MTGMYHHTWLLFGWDGISQTFCLDWPRTVILWISASWVARITGMSHCAQLENFAFTMKVLQSVETILQVLNFNLFLGQQYAVLYSLTMRGSSSEPQQCYREGKELILHSILCRQSLDTVLWIFVSYYVYKMPICGYSWDIQYFSIK
jgi:hypothetical protein